MVRSIDVAAELQAIKGPILIVDYIERMSVIKILRYKCACECFAVGVEMEYHVFGWDLGSDKETRIFPVGIVIQNSGYFKIFILLYSGCTSFSFNNFIV